MSNQMNAKMQSSEDLLQLYDYYIRKFAPEVPGVVVDSVNSSDRASLIVVDMQNDFIMPGGPGGPGTEEGAKHGRFSVTSGLSVVPGLVKFIQNNGSKFTKILFTRDAHPTGHCSFIPEKGAYPPHCFINHMGAALHKDFLQFKDLENADVVFKGIYNDADSYGGVDYPEDDYRNARQSASGPACCQGPACTDADGNDKTGGRYLKDHLTNRKQGFEDLPFKGVAECKDDNLMTPKVCPAATFQNIKDQLEAKPFDPVDLLAGQTDGTHTVFVVGLAGDYCVKDTAINLAKKIKANGGMLGGVPTKVVVIEPFTRYPTLPIKAMTWKDKAAYKNIPAEGQNAKNINAYVLEKNFTSGKIRRLKKNEVAGTDLTQIQYEGFINPIRPILKDYQGAGVTLLMNVPEVPGAALLNRGSEGNASPPSQNIKSPNAEQEGGRRKNRNKTRKMSKKNCWPKMKGGKKTRKPAGHKKGCKCVVCRR
jgi:nicotinamidase/pyrazinamidase